VIAGVSGAGKTAIGRLLAVRLGVPFADADSYHSASNIAKMASGTPLDDEDRKPWLQVVGHVLAQANETGMVMACSALRRSYRNTISECAPGVIFVLLEGSYEVLSARLRSRRGHFMPPRLLRSQLATLEPLAPTEDGFEVAIDDDPAAIVDRIVAQLARSGR
jgi:gluconokinase